LATSYLPLTGLLNAFVASLAKWLKALRMTFYGTAGKRAARLFERICEVSGSPTLVEDARRGMISSGVAKAVHGHDSAKIFDWLMEAVSFQGVSDAAAATYMAEHGRPQFATISEGLIRPACPKLLSYWHYWGCGFHKGSQTCTEPEHFARCAVPQIDLRNGRLNQSAYALRLFFRDVAGDDIVGWLDQRLAAAATERQDLRASSQTPRDALLGPLAEVHGISDKVLSMALATLLLGADPRRDPWVETGASMIAIDTLVHNWLHRTGILRDLGAQHGYGLRCYTAGGCAEIIERFAEQFDARQFNPDYPTYFPRFVQKAIWWFCAQAGHHECNGNRVDDDGPCRRDDCALGRTCARVPLRGPPRPHATLDD